MANHYIRCRIHELIPIPHFQDECIVSFKTSQKYNPVIKTETFIFPGEDYDWIKVMRCDVYKIKGIESRMDRILKVSLVCLKGGEVNKAFVNVVDLTNGAEKLFSVPLEDLVIEPALKR